MDDVDLSVLKALHQWRANGLDALLVTVSKTWGSSPRPVGAMMALRLGAEIIGSVSGGCIEDDLFERFSDINQIKPAAIVRYGISADEAHRFGLPCGGTIELVVEKNPCPHQLYSLIEQLQAGHVVRRTLDIASGLSSLELSQGYAPLTLQHNQLSVSLGPRWRMLLIGAGILAKYLAGIAKTTGFAVTVCDPRPEHSYSWDEADAPLLRCMPDDAVTHFKLDASACLITLSHDPKMDDLALIAGLNSPAFYVGAIGSRKNNQARRARLIEHFGFSQADTEKLHGPAGLFIDSKTPAEIAISIMAEVIAIKNGVQLSAEAQISFAKNQKDRLLLT